MQLLGVRRAMVVSGKVPAPNADGTTEARYLDELSTLADNCIAEFYQPKGFATAVLSPENFPLRRALLSDLLGGDREANATIVRDLLSGKENGPKRDAVLLNAAAALLVANRVNNLAAGWELAADTMESGLAFKKLNELACRFPSPQSASGRMR